MEPTTTQLVLNKNWKELIRREWPKRHDPWYRQSIREKLFLLKLERSK